MKQLRIIILIACSAFISACATTTTNITDTSALTADQGLVVTKFHTQWQAQDGSHPYEMEFYFYKDEGEKVDASFVMTKPQDLKVVALPPGRYHWYKVLIGDYFMDLDETQGFTIKPGQITYIGDIYSSFGLKMFSLEGDASVSNNSEMIKSELRQSHPKLMDNYEFATRITNIYSI